MKILIIDKCQLFKSTKGRDGNRHCAVMETLVHKDILQHCTIDADVLRRHCSQKIVFGCR